MVTATFATMSCWDRAAHIDAGMFLVFACPSCRSSTRRAIRALDPVWFVPLSNIVMLWVFAFSRWPSQDKV